MFCGDEVYEVMRFIRLKGEEAINIIF